MPILSDLSSIDRKKIFVINKGLELVNVCSDDESFNGEQNVARVIVQFESELKLVWNEKWDQLLTQQLLDKFNQEQQGSRLQWQGIKIQFLISASDSITGIQICLGTCPLINCERSVFNSNAIYQNSTSVQAVKRKIFFLFLDCLFQEELLAKEEAREFNRLFQGLYLLSNNQRWRYWDKQFNHQAPKTLLANSDNPLSKQLQLKK